MNHTGLGSPNEAGTHKKRAVIDIGSNTVRLVVYGGPLRAPTVLLNEKATPRLGRGAAKNGRLSEKAMEEALNALRRFAMLLQLMSVESVEVVATAATRDAENGEAFLRRVRSLGLSPRLLSGSEEAQASALGVIAGFPGAKGVVGDLGGGSLELIGIDGQTCGEGITLPFGTLRLPELQARGPERFADHLRECLHVKTWTGGRAEPLFTVGGSFRALALYAMHECGWPLDDPHGFELSPDDATRICKALAQGKVVREVPRISSSRLAALPDAAALLYALVREIEPARIVFSSWGLREGLLFAGLDETTRRENPLLVGIEAFVHSYGASSSAAADITRWNDGIWPDANDRLRNLRIAATMLSLAAMRTEPNLRAGLAMDWALRKRWIGLDASGRAMLAAAVLANSGITSVPDTLTGLAGKDDFRQAIGWGLTIRMCRRLTGCSSEALNRCMIERIDGCLVLTLQEPMDALYSSSTAKDLRKLADWLGLDWKVRQLATKAAAS